MVTPVTREDNAQTKLAAIRRGTVPALRIPRRIGLHARANFSFGRMSTPDARGPTFHSRLAYHQRPDELGLL